MNLHGKEKFYYSNNTKQYLSEDSTKLMLKFQNNIGSIISESFSRVDTVLENQNIIIVSKENIKNNDFLSSNQILYYGNLLKLDYSVIVPTNEIILMLNENQNIQRIIYSLGLENRLVFIKQDEYSYITLKVKNIEEVFDIANILYESKLTKWCHPNFILDIEKNTNDPLYKNQYYLENTGQFSGTIGIDIKVNGAWGITNGNSNTRVAVIDDGVEDHEDFLGRVQNGFTPRDPINGNGRPVGVMCGNTPCGHGVGCTGIIAATNDNNLGMAGICPNCNIVPVNIFFGNETVNDIANGINWAWNAGQASVISNSWSYNTSSPIGFDAITNAINTARTAGRNGLGTIVVFSSGNASSDVRYPANVNGVVTVGSIKNTGVIWPYSCTGSSMDLVAPSGNTNLNGDVRTTDRMGNNGYYNTNYMNTFGGTSAACPQVSGVAALMLSVNPNLTETQVRTILQQTATDMGAIGFDNTFGYGRVDACRAVALAQMGGNSLTISGVGSICNNNTQTFTTNVPNGTGASVIWSFSPANYSNYVNVVNNGNSITVTRTSNNNFLFTITATISNCTTFVAQKSINVGNPYVLFPSGGTTYPLASMEDCNITCYSPSQYSFYSTSDAYNGTVTWQKLYSYPANVAWSGYNNYVKVLLKAPNQTITLKRTISNACGSIEETYCFLAGNTLCTSLRQTSTPPIAQQLKVYPNPASVNNSLTLELTSDKGVAIDFENSSIQLVDAQNTIVVQKSGSKITKEKLDIPALNNGVYYIKVINKNGISSQQLIINN